MSLMYSRRTKIWQHERKTQMTKNVKHLHKEAEEAILAWIRATKRK